MAIQVIQRQQPRKPTFAEQIAPAIEGGMKAFSQYQAKQNQEKAFEKLGIDPSIANLPKEAQAEYFKNAFSQEKGLNPLQEAQKKLAEARLRDLEETQSFEKRLRGKNDIVDPNQTDLAYDKSKIPDIDVSQDELDYVEGYAGQPGKRGVLGNIAKTKREKEDKEKIAEQKKFESDREFHTKVSRPVIEAANETIKQSNVNKGIRQQIRRDIASGNTSGFFPFLVDKMGLESFRNPESARFTNEIKHLFVGSINDIPGARPNIFLERVLSAAQPVLGRDEQANLSIMDLDDFMEDVKLEQARQELQIAKEDRQKFGYVKEDVSERARDRMGDYVNRRQEEMALDIQKRKEDSMDNGDILNQIIGQTVPQGTYVTPRTMRLLYIKNNKDINKAVKEAESLGMVFPEYMEQ